jgi:hypothetical protein
MDEAEGGTYNGDEVTIEVAAWTYDENDTIIDSSLQSLTIDGTTGATSTILQGSGKGSDIQVGTPIHARTGSTFLIEGLTIKGGSGSYGGGLSNLYPNDMTITDDIISGNSATSGGGVANSGTMNLTDDTISGNSSPGSGGGLSNGNVMTLTDDTLSGNVADTSAGAVNFGTMNLTDDTISGNSARYGSGVTNGASSSHMTLTDDTISGNSATAGGGLWNIGIDTLSNSLLAHNSPEDCGATHPITDNGYNVADDFSCGFGTKSVSSSSSVGPLNLAANGSTGPETEAITTTSSAFGEVPAYACKIKTDERGEPRPGASTPSCDAGAFEQQGFTQPGYDMVGSDGGVFVFPTGQSGGFFGSLPGLGVSVHNIVGMVPTTTDQGYFLVGSDGGVFAFANAPFLGSLPGEHVVPAQPVTGIVAAKTDRGYFLVGRDGGVFAFGTVPFLGSLPGRGIQANNIIGIASTPSGNGYWLVSATGTVYGFGAAQGLGTAKGASSPVSAIAGTPTGGGYWIVTQRGAVYTFGNANFHDSLPGLGVSPAHPVIGIVHSTDTGGYWLIGSDGGIFAFGDAGFVGSLPGLTVHVTDVVGAVPTG